MGQRALLVDADRQGSSPLRLPRQDSTPLYGEACAWQTTAIASRYDDVVIDTGATDERNTSGQIVSFV